MAGSAAKAVALRAAARRPQSEGRKANSKFFGLPVTLRSRLYECVAT